MHEKERGKKGQVDGWMQISNGKGKEWMEEEGEGEREDGMT